MNKLLCQFLVVITFLFTCCTESKVKKDERENSVKENLPALEQPKPENDIVTYHPDKYEETIDDTVLNKKSNLRLYIKNYTLMDKGIDTTFIYDDGVIEKVHFRHNAAEIKITFGDSVLYSNSFSKNNLPGIETDKEFKNASIFHRIWLDNFNQETGLITLFCTVCVPDTDWCNFYKIYIDRKGKQKVILAEQT